MDKAITRTPADSYDIVILGAGYAGLMAAFRLAGRKEVGRIALVNESDRFLERVRLQESVSAPVAPRLSPLAEFVASTKIEFICGRVEALDATAGRIRIAVASATRDITFAQAIYALGSRIDVESVPGVAEHAYRLERGDGPKSAAALRMKLQENAGRALRVVVVGGAETATEVAGEIKTTWPTAEVTMIARSRCGDFEKGERVVQLTRAALGRLGIRLIDGETVTEVRAGEVVTASGKTIRADVCVWAGGLRATPIAKAAGLATDRQDRIRVDPMLRSVSHPRIRAVGDALCAIAPTGANHRLSAFAALVSGAYAADSITAEKRGRRPLPFSYSTFGQGVAIGRSGVGFPTYPNDRQVLFIITGGLARRVRNFFVWLLLALLKLERRFPGFFFWPGRRRVSWQQAEAAMRNTAEGVGFAAAASR